jgi:hypothetical protein
MARSRQPRTPKPALSFEMAPEVRAMAATLIEQWHPHLLNKRIEYIFRSRHAKHGRKQVMGRAKIISGLNAFLAMNEYGESVKENVLGEVVTEAPEPFFLVEIAKDIWAVLDHSKRKALVDHELAHLGIKGEKIIILGHDLEEFNAIVRRHGLWQEDVAAFVKAAAGTHQPELVLEEGGATEETPIVLTADECEALEAAPLLHWVTTLAMEEQTLPLREGPEPVLVVEVGTQSYKALVDKLGEQDDMVFLLGTHGPKDKRCLVQHVPGAADWPGLVVEAPVVEKPKRARSKK